MSNIIQKLASIFRLVDATDKTKKVAFDVSGVTTGTTRTMTAPNYDLTIAHNPMTTGGDAVYGGAAGLPTRLANGSSGQVLTSAGGTSAPTWTTPAAGSGGWNIKTKTTTYTATLDDNTILLDATGGIFTVTLPTAASAYNSGTGVGHVFTFVKIDVGANLITIDGNGSETINGNTTYVFSGQYEARTIQSNGTAWYQLTNVI